VRQVVVDASVILAGLFKNGTVRDTLLNVEGLYLTAPAFLREELEKKLPVVVERTGVPRETLESVLEDLLGAIDLVPSGVYMDRLAEARRLTLRANARGDEDYVALSLALGAPVWTLDKDFHRISGIRTLTTKEIDTL
jgi:predicted nucleic acid-binding protein